MARRAMTEAEIRSLQIPEDFVEITDVDYVLRGGIDYVRHERTTVWQTVSASDGTPLSNYPGRACCHISDAPQPQRSETPKVGQWWVFNDNPALKVYFVGRDHCDRLIVTTASGMLKYWDVFVAEHYHHEPACTGFDWMPPKPAEQQYDELTLREWLNPQPMGYSVWWTYQDRSELGWMRTGETRTVRIPRGGE